MKFESLGLIEVLRTDAQTLQRFFEELAKRYMKNPYHNFTHAVCLMHILYWIISQIDYAKFFSLLDIACMFIAAIGHDVGHPSTNNAFSIRT